eukprot:gene2517-2674_t
MGNSTASYLEFRNETDVSFRTSVSGIDNFDWDGDSRPDHNYNNITINQRSVVNQREELNAKAASSWYTIVFKNGGETITLRNDQRDAFKDLKRPYHIEGKYGLFQSTRPSESCNSFRIRVVSWMDRLPDNKLITALTIPGTHDSGTSNGPRSDIVAQTAKPWIVTQNWSIAEQLTYGIRFLDIRCNNNHGNFGIQHGDFDIVNQTFTDVLNACKNFLTQFPRETILMSVKEEGNPSGNISFPDAFRAQYVGPYPWYKGHDLPTLGAARGKIILISRFGDFDFGFNIGLRDNDYTNASYNGINYYAQDLYKVDHACDNKVNQVIDFAQRAASGSSNDFYLNFASGVNTGVDTLYQTAENVNPRVQERLGNKKGRFGVIPMDFPRTDLILNLIDSNI